MMMTDRSKELVRLRRKIMELEQEYREYAADLNGPGANVYGYVADDLEGLL